MGATYVQIIILLFTFTVQKYIYPPVGKVHAWSFRVSIIHQTLTWTTGSLMCIYVIILMHGYTRGLGTPTTIQHNIFDLEKLIFLCS